MAAAANEEDPDPQDISFRIESISSGTLDVDVGTLLEPGGSVVWHPDEGVSGTADAFTVRAWDGFTASANAVQVRVDIVVNVAPVLGNIGDKAVDEQDTLSFTATATDQDLPAQTLTFSLDQASLGAGMTIDSNTGEFSWTPSELQGGGTYPVRITVTDDGTGNLTDFETFNITVNVASTIRGHKFIDLDGDGVWDDSEPGLADWKIYLDENGSGQWDADEPFQLTDPDGNYTFTGLPAGTYTVAEVLQDGWLQTTPAAGFHSVTLTSGQDVTGLEFGNWQRTVSPGGPDLLPDSDTGRANDDDISRLDNSDNSTEDKRLTFLVNDTVPGMLVTLYSDDVSISDPVAATGSSTEVITNGNVDLQDGVHSITARQQEPGKAESMDSPALNVSIDTQVPFAYSPQLNDASDTGVFSGDFITQGIDPQFDGWAFDSNRQWIACLVGWTTSFKSVTRGPTIAPCCAWILHSRSMRCRWFLQVLGRREPKAGFALTTSFCHFRSRATRTRCMASTLRPSRFRFLPT